VSFKLFGCELLEDGDQPKHAAAGWVIYIYNIQGVSRLVNITAGGDFPGLCDQKSSYKHLSDFGRLRSYNRLKLRIKGNDYW